MSDSITNPENVTMSCGHDDGITASPRPWRLDDGFECEIVDATGRHVLTATSRYAVPPLGDEREAANAALIVAAVNERNRLRGIVRTVRDTIELQATFDNKGGFHLDHVPACVIAKALFSEARAAIGEETK